METEENRVTFQGQPLHLAGHPVAVGQPAPDFTAVANDLTDFRLSALKNKIIVISSVPSLDTPVCSLQTKRFNQEAGRLGDRVAIVTISMDLPFAQSRWCGTEGVSHLQTVSDHREAAFGLTYGLLIKELRLLARAVIIINSAGRIIYHELVREITHEPNYEHALRVLMPTIR